MKSKFPILLDYQRLIPIKNSVTTLQDFYGPCADMTSRVNHTVLNTGNVLRE